MRTLVTRFITVLAMLPFAALTVYANESAPAVEINAQSEQPENEQVSDSVQTAQAASVATSSASFSATNVADRKAKFYGMFSVTGVSDFKEPEDKTKSITSQFNLSLSYYIGEKDYLSLSVPFQKELSREYKQDFGSDIKVSHTKRDIFRYGLLDFRFTTSLTYPTAETSIKRDQMIAGVELSPRFDLVLNKYVKGLQLIYIPRYRRKFHKYTTNRAGDYIANESFMHLLVASWSFAERFAFESTFGYISSRRFDGASLPDSYMTVQELQYAVNRSFFLSVGVQTGGYLINPERGKRKGVEIFDENLSEFYTGVSFAF